MNEQRGIIDSLCLAFTPDHRIAWEEAVSAQGLTLKVREGDDDGFAEPAAMVDRMNELGVATMMVATCDVHLHPTPHQFSSVAFGYKEAAALASGWPGRFAALWGIEPQLGSAGVDRFEEVLGQPWVVGGFLHTHSFDRPFDHADLYPFYDACRRARVPMVMQAGASGGRLPSACGQPMGIDRPAIYFPDVTFVLSHTGWPWTEEAVAMARKFDNVYLNSASWPPRRWPASLVETIASPQGASKVLFATNFPTVGHRQALTQLEGLGLPDTSLQAFLAENAGSVFGRLTGLRHEEVRP